ncbi:MAG: hemolysin III family protein [Leptospirales bacterium]
MKSNIKKDKLNKGLPSRKQSIAEEMANVLTHFLGGLMAIAGFVLLLVFSNRPDNFYQYLSISIYGGSLIMVYTSSTLYHAIVSGPLKTLFRAIDQSAVLLLIAGTYTPVIAVYFHGAWSVSMLTFIWSVTAIGIALRFLTPQLFSRVAVVLYLIMGWSIVFAYNHAVENLPEGLFLWIGAGGVAYTAGLIFYVWKSLPFQHTFWHLFVIVGSAIHYIGLFINLTG